MSTLSTRARPAISRASASISGAAMRHGPHQEAQKSTSTGTFALAMISSNELASAAIGSLTGGSEALHAPQRPLSARCSAGIRFLAWQLGHTEMIENAIYSFII